MNFIMVDKAMKSANDSCKSIDAKFNFEVEFLDRHIEDVLKNSEASYEQVSFMALTIMGFILSHAGMKETSLMMLDFSNSGTGKSSNMTLQYKWLLKAILEQQDALQVSTSDEDSTARYINVHRGKITVPALYQCIKTVPAQLIMIDELGLLLQKDDDIIGEVTKLYGAEEASAPMLKTEAPSSKSIMPVALSFVGATTLSYFGSTQKLKHHLMGGFVNRALIAYNTKLKLPEEITSLVSQNRDYTSSNKTAVELLHFIKNTYSELVYSEASEHMLIEFKKEIQSIKIDLHSDGHDNYALFYNRVLQNAQTIINILHALKCFEKKRWNSMIDVVTVELGISFIKKIVFPEIEKLIDYLSDGDLLTSEERHKVKIVNFVQEYLAEHNKMPKIRDVSQKTRLSKNAVLEMIKDFLEVVPGTTILRYVNDHSREVS
ncbi:MAG: hypothetical protein AB7S65_00010 [Sulfuricurvum sp.]